MDKIDNIDIVILWVDSSDPKWLKQKNEYLGVKGDSNINRFRDFENLKYLFRGIEKYANWVNKIFFITFGHLPKWLNTNNDKLRIVKHEDFIPKEYLPTFNSNVIETNLFRIKELSNKFILFNDDLFILKNIKPSDFFKNDLPKDFYIEYLKKNCSRRHMIMKKNYLDIINKYFNKNDFINKNIFKVLNIKYGFRNIGNLKMITNKYFEDFYNQHLTQPILKEILENIWNKEYLKMNTACKNRFRSDSDIGISICRYWQLLSGEFYPTSMIGKYFELKDQNNEVIDAIKKQKYKIICVNDSDTKIDFEKAKKEINDALLIIFPQKSTFEI